MSTTKILIVDDSEVDRATYIRYLRSDEASYDIIEAETLEDGLELWREQTPDLALVDMNLPDGDGLEFLEAIAIDYPDPKLPAIVLTGQGDERMAVQAMKLGAADYIIKQDISAVSLCASVNQVRDRTTLTRQLIRSKQQEAVTIEIALRIRQSLDLKEVLNATVQEVRRFLAADRAIVFQFTPDMSGIVAAEAVMPPWPACIHLNIVDTCFRDNQHRDRGYGQGRIFMASDIYQANLTECHIGMLEEFKIRANLVVPILLPNTKTQSLWGLLIAHQCSRPRHWEEIETRLLQQLSVQLAIAIQQAELYQSLQKVNASLEEEKEAAEYANRAKSEFLALMSHEIRTPMNGILGLTHLAMQSNPNPQQQEYLTKIESSAQSLLQIINDILDFSKIESSKLELESAPFELDEILNNIKNILGLKAAEKNLELIFDIGYDIPRYLIGDSLRLGQVLINLTSNAIKFTEKGGVTIAIETIALTEKTVRLKFEVQDTGIGMTSSQVNTIFEAFTQADPSTSRKYGGTGLGLAICQRLVNLMGGKIQVESEPDRGSSFHFELELNYTNQSPANRQGDDIPDLGELNCLVVDDDPRMLDAIVHILESFSFRATPVSSGLESIEYLRQAAQSDPFELILIDRHMPEMDGIETIRKIQTDSQLADIPHILMVTPYSEAHIQQSAEELEVDAVVLKPIDRFKLFESILNVLGHQVGTYPHPKSPVSDEQLQGIQGSEILLVEDNPVNQQVARQLLERQGLQVEIAKDGREAIAKVQARSYDLILMDIRMPEIDGLEATHRIRKMAKEGKRETERFATVPIVAMTAHAMNTDKVKSLAAGMNDYVFKPVNPPELFATLVQWIAPGKRSPETISPPTEATISVPKQSPIGEPPVSILPGINIELGLMRMQGDWSLYHEILKLFHRNFQGFSVELQSALNQGDWEEMTHLVHSLKGVAGNIGAEIVYQSAATLELAIRQQAADPELLATKTLSLIQQLQQVLESINRLPDEPEQEPEPTDRPVPVSGKLDRSQLIPQLIDINYLLETDLGEAIASVETLKQQVAGTSLQEKVEEIGDRLTEFDTDAAESLLDEIRQILEAW